MCHCHSHVCDSSSRPQTVKRPRHSGAVFVPLAVHPTDLRGHDRAKVYGRQIVRDSGPDDFVVLAADDAIVSTTYLDVVEHATGNRVFLLPWLFYYPSYILELQRRHPGVTVPRGLDGSVSKSLRDWLTVNPGRGLCAEAVDYGPLHLEFPHIGARAADY